MFKIYDYVSGEIIECQNRESFENELLERLERHIKNRLYTTIEYLSTKEVKLQVINKFIPIK